MCTSTDSGLCFWLQVLPIPSHTLTDCSRKRTVTHWSTTHRFTVNPSFNSPQLDASFEMFLQNASDELLNPDLPILPTGLQDEGAGLVWLPLITRLGLARELATRISLSKKNNTFKVISSTSFSDTCLIKNYGTVLYPFWRAVGLGSNWVGGVGGGKMQ